MASSRDFARSDNDKDLALGKKGSLDFRVIWGKILIWYAASISYFSNFGAEERMGFVNHWCCRISIKDNYSYSIEKVCHRNIKRIPTPETDVNRDLERSPRRRFDWFARNMTLLPRRTKKREGKEEMRERERNWSICDETCKMGDRERKKPPRGAICCFSMGKTQTDWCEKWDSLQNIT